MLTVGQGRCIKTQVAGGEPKWWKLHHSQAGGFDSEPVSPWATGVHIPGPISHKPSSLTTSFSSKDCMWPKAAQQVKPRKWLCWWFGVKNTSWTQDRLETLLAIHIKFPELNMYLGYVLQICLPPSASGFDNSSGTTQKTKQHLGYMSYSTWSDTITWGNLISNK